MHEVKLGEKGQITLPKSIRDQYQLAKGDQVRMIDLGNGTVELILLKHSSELPPPVVKPAQRASTNEMKRAVREAAAHRYKKSRKR